MFECICKRTKWRVYVDTYDDSKRKIVLGYSCLCRSGTENRNYESPQDGSASGDPFMVVMNKEHDGYR
ncbi:hypothetical protein Hanom_Chr12g01112101 [Helianthus anomalus]